MATTNPMVPSPVCFGNNDEKAPYAALAMKKFLPDLKNQMKLGQLNVGSRRVVFDNGVIVTVNVCFNREVVDVYVPITIKYDDTYRDIDYVVITFRFRPENTFVRYEEGPDAALWYLNGQSYYGMWVYYQQFDPMAHRYMEIIADKSIVQPVKASGELYYAEYVKDRTVLKWRWHKYRYAHLSVADVSDTSLIIGERTEIACSSKIIGAGVVDGAIVVVCQDGIYVVDMATMTAVYAAESPFRSESIVMFSGSGRLVAQVDLSGFLTTAELSTSKNTDGSVSVNIANIASVDTKRDTSSVDLPLDYEKEIAVACDFVGEDLVVEFYLFVSARDNSTVIPPTEITVMMDNLDGTFVEVLAGYEYPESSHYTDTATLTSYLLYKGVKCFEHRLYYNETVAYQQFGHKNTYLGTMSMTEGYGKITEDLSLPVSVDLRLLGQYVIAISNIRREIIQPSGPTYEYHYENGYRVTTCTGVPTDTFKLFRSKECLLDNTILWSKETNATRKYFYDPAFPELNVDETNITGDPVFTQNDMFGYTNTFLFSNSVPNVLNAIFNGVLVKAVAPDMPNPKYGEDVYGMPYDMCLAAAPTDDSNVKIVMQEDQSKPILLFSWKYADVTPKVVAWFYDVSCNYTKSGAMDLMQAYIHIDNYVYSEYSLMVDNVSVVTKKEGEL